MKKLYLLPVQETNNAGSRIRRSSGDEGGDSGGRREKRIRKREGSGSKKGPGDPRDQGAEKVAAARVTCSVVTCSCSHVDRAARAPPGPEFCALAQCRALGGAPVQ